MSCGLTEQQWLGNETIANDPTIDKYGSVNRLIENGCAMALKVVSTGDINALNEAIEVLREAQHEMRMAECARIKASEREEIVNA
jgi:hypothetical protein